ncbi:MAG: hypothetical protein E7208_11200, partial [Clostridium butyricum]|nr:hypothetical protein [Clostridium butyricum]
MKSNKLRKIIALVLTVTSLSTTNVFAAWSKQGNLWYNLNSNGEKNTGWINDNGTWYYLNSSG